MKNSEGEMLNLISCVHRSRLQAGQMQEDVILSFYSSNVSIPHRHPPHPLPSLSRARAHAHATHTTCTKLSQHEQPHLSFARCWITHKITQTRKHTYMVRKKVLCFIFDALWSSDPLWSGFFFLGKPRKYMLASLARLMIILFVYLRRNHYRGTRY